MSDYPIVRPLLAMPRERESRTAFSATTGTLSFAALRHGMLGFAGWLVREVGVEPGDRVALCLPKSLEAIQAIYGILAAGAAYVGLQFRGPPVRLAAIIASTEPRVLLTTPEMRRQLAAEGGLAAMPPIVCIEATETATGLEPLLHSTKPLGDAARVGPDDLAAILFTSGSTGEPKGVMRSHRNMVENIRSHVRSEELQPHDMRIGNTQLNYISPNLFYPALGSCRIHLLSDQDAMFPAHIAEIMERERATIWGSVATALRMLIERGDLGRRDLSRVRLVKSYGEPLSTELLRAAMAAFPQARITSTYGATEAPNVARFDAPRPLPTDMRAVPLGTVEDGYEIRLCDDDGVEVAHGETGEICAFGPSVALGYWKDPALTAAKRLGGRADSYRTGDLARLGPNRELLFVGRKDELIKLRGNRFDLGEIEATLRRHPAVREAVAFSTSGSLDTADVFAAVEAATEPDLEQQLMRLCADRLPRFAWPRRISILTELPRLHNGKADRQRLRDRLAGTCSGAPLD